MPPPVPSFFATRERFLQTSETSAELGRLDLRYHAIFRENEAVFAGAEVVDIASHDGRWSLAALETGAAHVTGIEARPELVAAARSNLDHYVGDPARYSFLTGDVFEVLAGDLPRVDVVMCLGYLYHTLRFTELMSRIRALSPTWLVVDTAVSRQKGPFVRILDEPVERQGNAVLDPWSWNGRTLVGWPTKQALRLLLQSYGFTVEHRCRWPALVRDQPGTADVEDYARGSRVTWLARSVA